MQDSNPFANDLEVLNYALTLEHLENAFYKQVNGSGLLQGKAAAYLRIVGAHEQTHVDALTAAIRQAGGTPVAQARGYNFAALGNLGSQAGILAVSATLEATGVAAYDGAARYIRDKAVLAVAGSIVAVEARHTAAIRVLIDPNANPVPLAFERQLRPSEVLATVGPLIQQ
jgi:rubrerythrin